jgi:preprotein translocase subunit YajC
MSFFISDAMAQAAPAAQPGGDLIGLLFPIGLVVILYFFMIRPQVKRQKEHKTMVDALGKGDEIVTMGGMVGRITELGDEYATLEVADGVGIKIRRSSVETVLPKGSIKEM